ncbi:hypothetical protein DIPPA_15332 [Diplonema papillatum]|nr:hypothetical protein DIPPA_15332 [Diplonema papillatum]
MPPVAPAQASPDARQRDVLSTLSAKQKARVEALLAEKDAKIEFLERESEAAQAARDRDVALLENEIVALRAENRRLRTALPASGLPCDAEGLMLSYRAQLESAVTHAQSLDRENTALDNENSRLSALLGGVGPADALSLDRDGRRDSFNFLQAEVSLTPEPVPPIPRRARHWVLGL